MHDTIINTNPVCIDVCETTFDPRKVEPYKPRQIESFEAAVARSGSDAQFIAEYRRTLSMLNVRVQSDYSELKNLYQSQSRRLDALEGLVPVIGMQHHQVQDVTREVRALKRIVSDLQCLAEKQQQPLMQRLLAHFSNILHFKSRES